MTPRWLACVVVGLAAQAVYAQTAPMAAPEYEEAETFEEMPEGEGDSTPIAPMPPPELPQETPTRRPYPDAVWTSGHWFWDGDQWRFKPGAWIAPMPGYQFVNGYWQQDGSIWRWVSSGWAQPGSVEVEIPLDVVSEEVSTAQAPPPVQTEIRPAPPSPDLTWAPGYWYWSGDQWVWVDGTWVVPPRPGLVFVSPKWIRRAGSWVFVSGGWAPHGTRRIVVPVYRHATIAVRWGHPSYFLYSWHRYPVVRHYHGGWGRYRDRGYYRDRGPYRDRGYYRDRDHHRDRGHSGGWHRPGPSRRPHPATPVDHPRGGRHH